MKIKEQKYEFPNGEIAIIKSAGSEDAMKVKLHREATSAETHFMARHLYTKMGFKEYGMNPRAFKLKDGTYRDEIIMVNIFEGGLDHD